MLAYAGLAGSACSVNEVVVAEETKLVVAETPVDEALLLDIGIVEFDAGIPDDNEPEKSGIYEEIRNAETRFLAYHLKTTLQGTGHWGAVRVIPSRSAFTDVVITGVIEKSDGEYVDLHIVVADATGREWFKKSYEAQTGLTSYSERRDRRRDPYQKVFNDIANDLQAFVAEMPPKALQQTRQVSELQFFADMSPLAYGEHLQSGEDGLVRINRLPAENDPAVARLRQIRERAGILKNLKGVVFGQCTDCVNKGNSYGAFTLNDVLTQHLGGLGIPAYQGAYFGHITDQFTLPVGGMAEMDADAGTLRLLEPVVV